MDNIDDLLFNPFVKLGLEDVGIILAITVISLGMVNTPPANQICIFPQKNHLTH